MKLLLTTIAAVVLVGCGGAKYGSALFNAVNKGNIEAVELLIAKGVDVDAKDDRFIGQTPLHRAAWKSYKEIVELLIAAGADVNAKNDDGVTPLDTAIVGFAFVARGEVIMHKHPETADLLRKHGGKTGEELKAEGK